MIVSLIADFLTFLCHANTFSAMKIKSSITVSCECYPFYYSLGYKCSCSPGLLFIQETCRYFSNHICSSYYYFFPSGMEAIVTFFKFFIIKVIHALLFTGLNCRRYMADILPIQRKTLRSNQSNNACTYLACCFTITTFL